MSEPLISVIIPVYNTEKYLPKCLESVIGQTYNKLEIICINDSSTDNSEKILTQYAKKDKRIQVFTKENAGVSEARNLGLEKASGEYILFLDSDDWLSDNICERLLKAVEENAADVAMCDYMKEYDSASVPNHTFSDDIYFDKDDVKNKLHRRMVGMKGKELCRIEAMDNLAPVCMKLYKSGIIKENNIKFYDIRKIGTYEDGLFNFEFFEYAESAVYINEPLYHYRRNNLSLTMTYNENLQIRHEHLHKYMEEYIKTHNCGDEYEEALNNRIAWELVGYGLNILHKKEKFSSKLSDIKAVLKNPYYKASFERQETKYMRIHWRVFFGCARQRLALSVYVLLRCIEAVRNRA